MAGDQTAGAGSEVTANYPVDLPNVIDKNYESEIINQKYDFIQEIIDEVVVNKTVRKL